MRRRSLLRATAALSAGVLSAGCSTLGRPAVRLDSGRGTIHPATDRYVRGGLEPDGDRRTFATAAPDRSPDLVGPDAQQSFADVLRNERTDGFHVVVQIRSTPEEPTKLHPNTPGSAFEWVDRSTLRAAVTVDSWGSLDSPDPERRRALRSAEELVFTAVWSLTPDLEDLPDRVLLDPTEA